MSDKNLATLQQQVQTQLQWWVQLVQVTGGKLNPNKCCGLLYNWEPDKHGILWLQQPDLPMDFLLLQTITDTQSIPIPKNAEGTCYLGLYLTIDRNTKPMEQHLWKKALIYTTAFRQTPMSHHEAGVLY